MAKGTLKRFIESKGFGFIAGEDGEFIRASHRDSGQRVQDAV
jgi:cold shock CspA family protein